MLIRFHEFSFDFSQAPSSSLCLYIALHKNIIGYIHYKIYYHHLFSYSSHNINRHVIDYILINISLFYYANTHFYRLIHKCVMHSDEMNKTVIPYGYIASYILLKEVNFMLCIRNLITDFMLIYSFVFLLRMYKNINND